VLIRKYWPLALIVVVAAGVSIVVHTQVFPAYSWNRDEPVYLWQVQGLRAGQVFMTDGGHPLFFQPWLSGLRDGSYFSQYTLGWPLVLLFFDVVFGTAAGAIVFGTALAVIGTYALARELTQDHALALVAAGALTLSPLLVVQSGVYLGYLFSLGLGTLFGAALLAGARQKRWWLLLVAGALIGWLFMTRPFDAFLWALAFGAYLLFAYHRELRALLPVIGWGGLGFLPLLVATLAYNKHITGSFTQFPITAVDSRDTFGFGVRGFGTRWPAQDFGVKEAVRGLGRNGWELPPFLVGSYLGVAAALVGFWLRRRQRSTYALLAVAIAFPVGYFFFWGIALSAGFARVSGPIYLIPMFAPLCILVAAALVALWRARRGLAIGLAAVVVLATVPFLVDRVDLNHSISEAQVPWLDAQQHFHGRSLVFVEDSGPYLIHLDPFSSNAPNLDARVLYATDRQGQNIDVVTDHPRRHVYFERTSLTIDQTLADPDLPVPTVTVTPAHVERSGAFLVRAHVRSTTDDPIVTVYLKLGAVVDQRTLSTSARRGDEFDTEWQLRAPSADGGPGPDVSGLPAGTGAVEVGVRTAPSPGATPRGRYVFAQAAYHAEGSNVAMLLPARTYRARTTAAAGLTARSVGPQPSLRVEIAP
jgi:hypothetical protein